MKIQNKYEIDYSTRKGSRKFLLSFGNENTGTERERLNYEDNIDFFFMYHAYKAIESWFKNHIGEKDKFKELFKLMLSLYGTKSLVIKKYLFLNVSILARSL